ncbi:MAG: hypothetical protein WCK34_03455 [Bacteroidota bacterium]
MKLLIIATSFMALILIIPSCKKDKNTGSSDSAYPNYALFKAGSYWVYQEFTVDSAGNSTSLNFYDSCYVMKDTVINNKTYACSYRQGPYSSGGNYSIVRDSLHYLVTPAGKIVFSSQDFQTIFSSEYSTSYHNDTMCHIVTKMADPNFIVNTPAGTFATINSQAVYYMYPGYANGGKIRFVNKRYAENIGIVEETLLFWVYAPNRLERRLVRYHVNE